MEFNWDDVRWLQNAYDLSGSDLAVPVPLIRGALSLLDGSDERPTITRSALTEVREEWTLMSIAPEALIHVQVSYQPPREPSYGYGPDRADERDHEIRALRVPLHDIRLAVVGVTQARISHLHTGEQWRADYVVSAPGWGLEERVEVSRLRNEHGREAAEGFLGALVSASTGH